MRSNSPETIDFNFGGDESEQELDVQASAMGTETLQTRLGRQIGEEKLGTIAMPAGLKESVELNLYIPYDEAA